MKFFTSLIITLIAIIYLGDMGSSVSAHNAETQRPTTLFSVDAEYGQQVSNEDNGLWESSVLNIAGTEVQYRWQKSNGFVTVAKSCTIDGETVVAQSTLNLNSGNTTSSPSTEIEISNGKCELSLNKLNTQELFIDDLNLVFTGDNEDGSKEFTVLVDEQTEVDGILAKIQG